MIFAVIFNKLSKQWGDFSIDGEFLSNDDLFSSWINAQTASNVYMANGLIEDKSFGKLFLSFGELWQTSKASFCNISLIPKALPLPMTGTTARISSNLYQSVGWNVLISICV